ncbi:MAG: hypothetical protein PHQ62_00085 [Clostridia bacterium]|nr:hypothetical protein [Clostridia bacterium]
MEKKFFYCRASIIFDQQIDFLKKPLDYEDNIKYRNKIFWMSVGYLKLEEKQSFLINNKEIIYFVKKINESFLKIELGMRKILEKIVPLDNDFHKELDLTYPHISVYIEKETQIIYFEENPEIVSFSSSVKYVQEIINYKLKDDAYKLFILPMSHTPNFWSHIQNNNLLINEVAFTLLAPNFLGASGKAKDIAKQLHQNNNAEKFTIRLVSDTGLIIREDFSSYVDYTSEGAGTWSIKATNRNNKRKVTYKQKEKVKKTNVKIIEEEDKIIMEIKITELLKKGMNHE